ncbi:membrane-associated guanylate kinase, WW and PDZ domain-containing protein 1 [Zeugodacus cucurbitae]|uniref:membrane-associated guanylate kinase, WW and PDZ domain-containing protein 1 n=1 Tax=Zeugodacus cucurbitae TaxID=28588 RepID=UPI0005968348|nr:membrane-associated guanylate kinase, WW and PDZ domain-containing protein 1 [Zeugodacus cucurbitae]XP_011185474.1 membrane-associated guanylate kinase, WW and PDZ domain-containing protein 1 [Zeugodacus cucurbitae]XP_011185476.1 membrane-associated guanylate kinase, WW and PDZ domain-containing protein 1 [Zeugodacus cucurbitae]XP_011185478.1 membrane-associated guanylate kinase, WW and PDZ domain-containing protein 1 [Zeugodacus cucurbitae]XP_028897320.1 membrane-associated guanylate kinase
MPTLAAKNSQATIANMATAATTTTGTAINSGASEQCDSDVVTATRIATPTDTQNSGGALNHHHHHYHHSPAPHGGAHAASNVLSTMMVPATATTTTTAGAATNTVAASLATFNGNSNLNVANGNIGGNRNHNNSHNHSHTVHTGAGGVGKKSLTNMHASREDVASPTQPQAQLPPPPLTQLGNAMPTASINNQQLSATNSQSNHNHNNNNMSSNMNGSNGSNINNSNGNGNGSANISSILKGSKENLLQNSYNGAPTSDNIVLDIDDPGDGLGPLPPKWETAYTERGELYFIDHNTGTSHWLDPRLSKFQKKSLEDCGDDELPYGWEKIEDSLYGTYYIDHVNRRTQYENPVLEAKRRAAEQRQKQLQQPPPPAHSSAQNMQGVGYTTQQQQPPPPPPTSQPTQQQQQLRPQTPSTQMTSNLVNGAGMGGNVIGGADDGNDRVTPALGNNMVDISQRGMQPPPTGLGMQSATTPLLPYKFTRNPGEMQGERITASLVKSARGLGITIVGGDDGAEEFLQIKSIVPHGPAWLDGQLQMGDVLMYVNDTCVLGFTHHEMVNIFQSILPGETVTLEVCRGYPLPFDPNDPNTEVVTTIAVDGVSVAATDKQRRMLLDLHMDGNYNFLETIGGDGGGTKAHTHNQMRNQHSPVTGGLNDGFILMKKPELHEHTFTIVKGAMGFGFTIADSAYGQKVKKILDYNCCTHLQEGDVLLEINGIDVHQQSHLEVVQILKDCSKTEPTHVKIQRGGPSTNSANASPSGGAYNTTGLSNPPPTSSSSNNSLSNVAKLRKNFTSALFRSKTPTADLYSTQPKEILPIRPKTPLVDTRRTRAQTPNDELQHSEDVNDGNLDGRFSASKHQLDAVTHKSTNSLQEIEAISQDIPFLDPYPKLVTSLSERLAGATLLTENVGNISSNGCNIDNMGGLNMGTDYHHASGLSLPSSVADPMRYEHQEYVTAGMRAGGNNIYGISPLPNSINNFYAPQQLPTPPHLSISASSYSPATSLGLTTTSATHHNILHHHPLQLPPPPPPASHMHGHPHGSQYSPASLHSTTPLQAAHIQNERMQKRVNELLSDRRRVGFSTLDMAQPQKLSPAPYANQQLLQPQQQQQPPSQHSPAVSSVSQQPTLSWLGQASSNYTNAMQSSPSGNLPFLQRNGGAMDALDELTTEQYELSEITLERQALGFGFRIVGGTEEGSQVTVGHIVPGGAADNDHRINTGDEILSIDGINVVNSSHHKVVSLMGEAALRGQVTMILRRRLRLTQHQPQLLQSQQQQLPLPLPPPLNMPMRNTYRYPYDVIVSRHESEGFGFVIISSSNQFYGSTIGKLIPGSPADRCGELKVGDRIIAVNRIDISGMSHGDVVNLIKESGLHVRLTIGCPKDALTTPTSTLGTQNSALIVNSAQVSPGQLSQNQLIYTPLTTQQPHKPQISPNLLSNNQNGGNYFMEQPRTSAATTNFVQQQQHTHSSLQQQHQQQQQQQLLPPQL